MAATSDALLVATVQALWLDAAADRQEVGDEVVGAIQSALEREGHPTPFVDLTVLDR